MARVFWNNYKNVFFGITIFVNNKVQSDKMTVVDRFFNSKKLLFPDIFQKNGSYCRYSRFKKWQKLPISQNLQNLAPLMSAMGAIYSQNVCEQKFLRIKKSTWKCNFITLQFIIYEDSNTKKHIFIIISKNPRQKILFFIFSLSSQILL